MLDIKDVRNFPEKVKESIAQKGLGSVNVDDILKADHICKELQNKYDNARASQRSAGREGGKELKTVVVQAEHDLKEARQNLNGLMLKLPNFMAEGTPLGVDDNENIELEVYGEKPNFTFQPKDHVELGEKIGLDLESGTNIAGKGFPILRGQIALLEKAIMQFVVDEAMKKGFEYMQVPLVARPDILRGIGFSPRRDDAQTEIFNLADDDLCLAGTAEISLVGHLTGKTIETTSLPIRIIAQNTCFRREGGAGGRRDRGLYRQKMFNKAELVVIDTPEDSEKDLEEIKGFEIEIFKKLGICFRVVLICAGDMGAPAYKKYDLEGLMYGRTGRDDDWGWGELTSCSNCTDFQARRLGIYYKDQGTKGRGSLVHTLNGTGVTTRALIPVLEQFQNEDGSITIPKVLQPYMGGQEVIKPA